jgi:hypothetical protein
VARNARRELEGVRIGWVSSAPRYLSFHAEDFEFAQEQYQQIRDTVITPAGLAEA